MIDLSNVAGMDLMGKFEIGQTVDCSDLLPSPAQPQLEVRPSLESAT